MKIISLGSDRNLFIEGSQVRERIAQLGGTFDKYLIIVHTLKSRDGKLAPVVLNATTSVIPTNSKNRLFMLWDMFLLAKENINDPRWVITTQDPFWVGILGLILSKIKNIKFVAQVHTDIFSTYFKKMYRMQYFCAYLVCRHATRVRVVRRSIADNVYQRFGVQKDRIIVLPVFIPPTNPDLFQSNSVYSHDVNVLICARLTPEKNVQLAIRSFARIQSKNQNTGLYVVGDGPERRYLENLVISLGLASKVHFLGWKNNITTLLSCANALLVPSFFEGYSMVMVEAAQYRCPIVTTPVGLAQDLLADAAFISRGFTVEAFSSVLHEALTNKDKCSRYVEKAVEKTKREIQDIEIYQNQYRKIFEF